MDVAIFRADVAAAAADDDGGPVRGRERLRGVVNDVNDAGDESMMISERLKVTSSRALLLKKELNCTKSSPIRLLLHKKNRPHHTFFLGGLTLFLLSTSFFVVDVGVEGGRSAGGEK